MATLIVTPTVLVPRPSAARVKDRPAASSLAGDPPPRFPARSDVVAAAARAWWQHCLFRLYWLGTHHRAPATSAATNPVEEHRRHLLIYDSSVPCPCAYCLRARLADAQGAQSQRTPLLLTQTAWWPPGLAALLVSSRVMARVLVAAASNAPLATSAGPNGAAGLGMTALLTLWATADRWRPSVFATLARYRSPSPEPGSTSPRFSPRRGPTPRYIPPIAPLVLDDAVPPDLPVDGPVSLPRLLSQLCIFSVQSLPPPLVAGKDFRRHPTNASTRGRPLERSSHIYRGLRDPFGEEEEEIESPDTGDGHSDRSTSLDSADWAASRNATRASSSSSESSPPPANRRRRARTSSLLVELDGGDDDDGFLFGFSREPYPEPVPVVVMPPPGPVTHSSWLAGTAPPTVPPATLYSDPESIGDLSSSEAERADQLDDRDRHRGHHRHHRHRHHHRRHRDQAVDQAAEPLRGGLPDSTARQPVRRSVSFASEVVAAEYPSTVPDVPSRADMGQPEASAFPTATAQSSSSLEAAHPAPPPPTVPLPTSSCVQDGAIASSLPSHPPLPTPSNVEPTDRGAPPPPPPPHYQYPTLTRLSPPLPPTFPTSHSMASEAPLASSPPTPAKKSSRKPRRSRRAPSPVPTIREPSPGPEADHAATLVQDAKDAIQAARRAQTSELAAHFAMGLRLGKCERLVAELAAESHGAGAALDRVDVWGAQLADMVDQL
ncbi:hypothetical protein AMAG_01812 [Allomyces macrogynus ATCC 38327]|uniref:Uncharacterized protein n=1 Tax=Allomyces macrogynus (strain ATCC 38327) TaxID=578462 RepID=A0A0L0S0S8_ALLM3|nr:hypothetical protein AMAG_01812 [Allomyces macrogynus ATCC 38327]|eukprot:KNE55961.1 hypothetical protein AMAG_01812 [Allomyces macrogynus ATCC 38327]